MTFPNAVANKKSPYSALSNEVRLDLISSLTQGDKHVAELVTELGLGRTLITHNLKKLETVGFVTSRKQGKLRIYSLDREVAAPFMASVGLGLVQNLPPGLLRTVLGQTVLNITLADARGTIMFICGGMIRRGIFPAAEYIGRSIYELFTDKKNAVVNISAALRGETVRWRTSRGEHDLEVTSSPFRDRNGRVIGELNIAHEVTPRLRAEMHLKEEGEWKALAEGTPYTLLQIGRDGLIQAINRHTRPLETIIGKPLVGMLPKEFQAVAGKAIAEALKTGEMTMYRTKAMYSPSRPDDVWYECRVLPFSIDRKIAGATIAGQRIENP